MPIPWDTDVDVGVWISDWKPEIVERLLMDGFTHDNTVGTTTTGLTERLYYKDVRMDIHFYYRDEENDQVFIQTYDHDGRSYRESWTPFVLHPADVFGMVVNVPADYELYLKEGYGEYMTKRTKNFGWHQWDSMTSPPNSGPGTLHREL